MGKCANCDGTGIDGYDRCYPPNPYVCQRCDGTGEIECATCEDLRSEVRKMLRSEDRRDFPAPGVIRKKQWERVAMAKHRRYRVMQMVGYDISGLPHPSVYLFAEFFGEY